MKGARVKRVYGNPWSRMVQRPIPITRETLHLLGKAIVDAILHEARVDLANQRPAASADTPVGIPESKAFFKSFGYRIVGDSTIEVTCTWPYIDQLIEGRKPFLMYWLTQVRGVDVVPLKQAGGKVLFRTTPLKLSDAWVHPGFAKHSFIQRGIKKGRVKMAQVLTQEAAKYMFTGDPLL